MALSVESICNSALRRTKYPTPIGSIYEGSRASRFALDFYGVTRDWLLRNRDWDFTQNTVSLGSPLKTAPVGGYALTAWTNTYPQPPWIYEYAYPSNCLEVLGLLPSPGVIPEAMPRYVLFEKSNDTVDDVAQPVILTNLGSALAMITAKVTDPAQWTDPGFLEALIEALAVRFTMAFDGDVNAVVLSERNADGTAMAANARQG